MEIISSGTFSIHADSPDEFVCISLNQSCNTVCTVCETLHTCYCVCSINFHRKLN